MKTEPHRHKSGAALLFLKKEKGERQWQRQKKRKLTGRKRDERVAAYIFVAPAVILLIAFLVVPMIYTVYFSGFKYQIMS